MQCNAVKRKATVLFYIFAMTLSGHSITDNDQLSLTNLQDALHHGERAANK